MRIRRTTRHFMWIWCFCLLVFGVLVIWPFSLSHSPKYKVLVVWSWAFIVEWNVCWSFSDPFCQPLHTFFFFFFFFFWEVISLKGFREIKPSKTLQALTTHETLSKTLWRHSKTGVQRGSRAHRHLFHCNHDSPGVRVSMPPWANHSTDLVPWARALHIVSQTRITEQWMLTQQFPEQWGNLLPTSRAAAHWRFCEVMKINTCWLNCICGALQRRVHWQYFQSEIIQKKVTLSLSYIPYLADSDPSRFQTPIPAWNQFVWIFLQQVTETDFGGCFGFVLRLCSNPTRTMLACSIQTASTQAGSWGFLFDLTLAEQIKIILYNIYLINWLGSGLSSRKSSSILRWASRRACSGVVGFQKSLCLEVFNKFLSLGTRDSTYLGQRRSNPLHLCASWVISFEDPLHPLPYERDALIRD